MPIFEALRYAIMLNFSLKLANFADPKKVK
jgi:hypothetical protein